MQLVPNAIMLVRLVKFLMNTVYHA